jgi:predicted phosphodiesterase
MRILALSDLHVDFPENRLAVERLAEAAAGDEVLIVAGDIADRCAVVAATLRRLRAAFRHVFYVPGNHELWVRDEPWTSLDKFHALRELCARLDVHTQPAKVGGVWIVPLFSWYQASFDVDDRGDRRSLSGWRDFYCCRWPVAVDEVAEFFLGLNEAVLRPYDGPVISFSHFLPRRDLLPSAERLRFKGLPKVAGCAALDAHIRQLKARVHVFGHSHIGCDRLIDGVRYVQQPLRYPRERHRLRQAGKTPDTLRLSGIPCPVFLLHSEALTGR